MRIWVEALRLAIFKHARPGHGTTRRTIRSGRGRQPAGGSHELAFPRNVGLALGGLVPVSAAVAPAAAPGPQRHRAEPIRLVLRCASDADRKMIEASESPPLALAHKDLPVGSLTFDEEKVSRGPLLRGRPA